MAKNNQPPAANTSAVSTPADDIVLYGTDALPARVVLIDSCTVDLGDIVRRAVQDTKLAPQAWNELAQADRDAAVLAARDVLAEEVRKSVDRGEVVECAVLYDSIYGKHDAIILLAPAMAKDLAAQGYVDPHPNAIKALRAGA